MPLQTLTCRSGNRLNRADTLHPRSLHGHIEEKKIMEINNTTENVYLSVDGMIPETFGSTGHHHPARMASPAGAKTIPLVKKHSRFSRSMTLSPIRRLQCRDRVQQQLSDNGIKAALGLIKPRNCRRIVVLGAPRVGKTNILQQFLGEEFKEHYEATTEDFHTKLYHIRGQEYQIDILDAAGERHFPAKRRLSILTGDIFLLVFSVDNRESFSEVCELLKEIKTAKSKLMKLKDTAIRVPVVVCGNKVDLDMARVVSRFEIDEILGEEVAYFETSAKEGTGLPGVFSALAKQGRLPNETSPSEHQNISIHTYQLLCTSQREWRPSRLNGPLATMYPLARRPSFQSDLQQVKNLGGGPSMKQNKHEKCHVQ